MGMLSMGSVASFSELMLGTSAKLYGCRSRPEMLDTLLGQARHWTGAEAGSIYLIQRGRLRFVAVQNDAMDTSLIAQHLQGKELPVSPDSLVGFAAISGRLMNIPDSYSLPGGAPFRINRELDAKTGYHIRSILAIPLACPDGECVGVLELFNCLLEGGVPGPFPSQVSSGIMSLSTLASIMLHNMGLQEQLREVNLDTIFRLSTIAEYRDSDTSEHVQRVSSTSVLLARAMGLGAEESELIKFASPMHDVGKVAIPDAVLLKPGPLTPRERGIMERHTVVGASIFKDPQNPVLAMARDVAMHHHERWDGQGYPSRLERESTPLPGRIVGLADVFDAIVSRRCYKEACTLDVALDILRKDSGQHFDPDLVQAFLAIVDKVLEAYPELRAA